MKSCCESKASELEVLKEKQGKVLKTVLWINFVMFVLEFSFGIVSRSAALLADSLDMLGDAAVYGFSLYVLHRSLRWKAKATVLKGLIMVISGLGIGIEVIRRAIYGGLPEAQIMGAIGVLALLANALCAFLLFRHREDDSNLRSTWLCSRNDVIANLGVITASVLVAFTNSKWPDIIVGTIIAGLFLQSAFSVGKDALADFRKIKENPNVV